jgi:hypothetical protein
MLDSKKGDAMSRTALAMLLCGGLLAGCTQHLVFLENSHIGLKASFEPNNPTPAEVDVGFRRAIFAMVPQKSAEAKDDERKQVRSGSVTVTKNGDGSTRITVVPDPNELMSMYAVYQGNIGFDDPIDIYHFMATGVAASNLLANQNSLRDLVKVVVPQQPKSTPVGNGESGK